MTVNTHIAENVRASEKSSSATKLQKNDGLKPELKSAKTELTTGQTNIIN